jgi:hypothetical protein
VVASFTFKFGQRPQGFEAERLVGISPYADIR